MKGLIIGLAAGMAAGALISANFSEVRKLAKKAGNAVGMKPKGGMQSGGMQNGANGGCDCECGEDRNCCE